MAEGTSFNLGADANTLEVEGRENLSVHAARAQDRGGSERNFCKHCGSFLWLFNPMWPEIVHPFASAIDTPLPKPPERVRLMLDYAAPWCEIPENGNELLFPEYPEESLEECTAATVWAGERVGPINVHDYERLTRERLSPGAWAHYSSGSDDEATLREDAPTSGASASSRACSEACPARTFARRCSARPSVCRSWSPHRPARPRASRR